MSRAFGGTVPCPKCKGQGVVRVALKQGRYVEADEMLMALPAEDVQTIREEVPCPICGAELQIDQAGGGQCVNCGFELPPEGLRDPDTEPDGVAMEQQQGGPPPEEEEGEEGDEDDEDENGGDRRDQKKEGGSMAETRIEEIRGRQKGRRRAPRTADGSPFGTHDVGTHYDQGPNPANSVGPYGAPAEVQPVPPAEPPVATRESEMAADGLENVQDLDSSSVVAPQGQSAVNVGGGLGMSARREAAERLQAKATVYEAKARDLRKRAEMVVRDNVQDLDAPTPVNVQPDAVVDVTRPTQQPDQLALADTPDMINDGTETGILPVADRVPGQGNPYSDVGPYFPPGRAVGSAPPRVRRKRPSSQEVARQIREARRDAGARVIRIANLVDQRVELGLTEPGTKVAEISDFEKKSDAEIEGYMQATEEFRAARTLVAGRKVPVKSAGRAPEMGDTPQPAAALVGGPAESDDPANDGAYFV